MFIFLPDPGKRLDTGSTPGQPGRDGAHCTSALGDTDSPDAISPGLLWLGGVSSAPLSHQRHAVMLVTRVH